MMITLLMIILCNSQETQTRNITYSSSDSPEVPLTSGLTRAVKFDFIILGVERVISVEALYQISTYLKGLVSVISHELLKAIEYLFPTGQSTSWSIYFYSRRFETTNERWPLLLEPAISIFQKENSAYSMISNTVLPNINTFIIDLHEYSVLNPILTITPRIFFASTHKVKQTTIIKLIQFDRNILFISHTLQNTNFQPQF